MALWWPFTDHRYKLEITNPIDYTWSNASIWEISAGVLKITLTEFMNFAPIFLLVVLLRRVVSERFITAILSAKTIISIRL